MSDSQEVKMARIEERMKNVEKTLASFQVEVFKRFDELQSVIKTDTSMYATKSDLQELKQSNFIRLIFSIIASAGITYLVTFYFANK